MQKSKKKVSMSQQLKFLEKGRWHVNNIELGYQSVCITMSNCRVLNESSDSKVSRGYAGEVNRSS